MKLYVECKNKEIKEEMINQLQKRGFGVSLNSCGTMVINNIDYILYHLKSIKLENSGLHDYELNLDNIDYIEVQK